MSVPSNWSQEAMNGLRRLATRAANIVRIAADSEWANPMSPHLRTPIRFRSEFVHGGQLGWWEIQFPRGGDPFAEQISYFRASAEEAAQTLTGFWMEEIKMASPDAGRVLTDHIVHLARIDESVQDESQSRDVQAPSWMALVKPNDRLHPCPDCGRMISNAALGCPGCGRPLQASGRGNEETMEIRVRQTRDMDMLRSLFADAFERSTGAVYRYDVSAHVTGPSGTRAIEIGWFKASAWPDEKPEHVNYQGKPEALVQDWIDRCTADGWRIIAREPFWFSYRLSRPYDPARPFGVDTTRSTCAITFIRKDGLRNFIDIEVDGHIVTRIPRRTSFKYNLEPGDHTIRLLSSEATKPFRVRLTQGEEIQLLVGATAGFWHRLKITRAGDAGIDWA